MKRVEGWELSEVVRLDRWGPAAQRVKAFRLDGRHTFLNLERAFHEQIRLGHDRRAVFREQIGTHDDIRDARLVLEREEHESFRGARTLPCDDGAGDAHA